MLLLPLQMLHYLQEFSQKMISRTHDIQEQMNGLIHEAKVSYGLPDVNQ